MQLKITQKILNLSFNDKVLEETENSQEILNIFENRQKTWLPNISRILKIFWGFWPSKSFEEKNLQILNIEVWVFR